MAQYWNKWELRYRSDPVAIKFAVERRSIGAAIDESLSALVSVTIDICNCVLLRKVTAPPNSVVDSAVQPTRRRSGTVRDYRYKTKG